MCYGPMKCTFSQARTVKCFFGSYQEKILFCGNMATQSQYFTTLQRKFLSGKNKALFIVLLYTFIYGIVVVPPPALEPHCDLREGCQTLQRRGLSYVLEARVSMQGISLPLLHTLLPPHRQPSTAGSVSSTALLEGECATAAHHKHFISIPCSLVVHPAANDFLPHCAGFFLLRGSRELECTAEVQTSRNTALPAGFYPWPWPEMGDSSGKWRGHPKFTKGNSLWGAERRALTARGKSLMLNQGPHAHGLQHCCK